MGKEEIKQADRRSKVQEAGGWGPGQAGVSQEDFSASKAPLKRQAES